MIPVNKSSLRLVLHPVFPIRESAQRGRRTLGVEVPIHNEKRGAERNLGRRMEAPAGAEMECAEAAARAKKERAEAAARAEKALKDALASGLTLKQLRAKGHVEGLKAVGITCAEAKTAGYTLEEVKRAGFVEGLKEAGFQLEDIIEAEYKLPEILRGGFTKAEAVSAGYAVAQLQTALKAAREAGFTCKDAREAGFTYKDAREAGFSMAFLLRCTTAGQLFSSYLQWLSFFHFFRFVSSRPPN